MPRLPEKPVRPYEPKPPGAGFHAGEEVSVTEESKVSRSVGKVALAVFLTWITGGLYGLYKLYEFISDARARRRSNQQWEATRRRQEDEYLRAREFYEDKLVEYEADVNEHAYAIARAESE